MKNETHYGSYMAGTKCSLCHRCSMSTDCKRVCGNCGSTGEQIKIVGRYKEVTLQGNFWEKMWGFGCDERLSSEFIEKGKG